MTELVIYLLIGKLLIYTLQKYPFSDFFPDLFREGAFLKKLFDCDFCLGFWVYFVLTFVFGMNFFYEYFYIVLVSEVLTGITASFVMHLLSIGWKDKFGTFLVE
jgi:hypothetical protein